MIRRARVVGRGRVGSAIAGRLEEQGVDPDSQDPELLLLCVPDRAISEVAPRFPPGPWIAHTSGAVSLAALAPHTRRFTLHPLQTFTRKGGPEQLDGAYAAIASETDQARRVGFELAETLGLRPFPLNDEDRALYHVGAVFASNYLVTLHRVAARLFEKVGAPPEGLEPLMRRTIENGFQLTGPIARGDWETVKTHLEAIRAEAPELEPVYRALGEATVP
ncbi:MAG: Rossmann-like and DUF2520 domain-containing protein [Acidimicrobiia bacterium]